MSSHSYATNASTSDSTIGYIGAM